MSWVVVVAVGCMMVYTTLGAKLGVVAAESPGGLLARKPGAWFARLIGIAVFFIATTFQFANNLGLDAAVRVYTTSLAVRIVVVVAFNLLSLWFLFRSRNVYAVLERVMTVFVAVMLLAFAVNLCVAAPAPSLVLRGFAPSRESFDVVVLGLIGTTFSAAAAYYQAYLVRQKGWTRERLADGLLDARIAGLVMGGITLMLVWTAATVLHGRMTPDQIKEADASAIANQLAPLLGAAGVLTFCIGLVCAAYSSFLVNSMIGGYVLADGIGAKGENDALARVLTAVALVVGMGVAINVMVAEAKPVSAIVAAQALTVIVSPLLAGVLVWLTNRRDVMGEARNGWILNALAVVGLVVLLAAATGTSMRVWAAVFPTSDG